MPASGTIVVSRPDPDRPPPPRRPGLAVVVVLGAVIVLGIGLAGDPPDRNDVGPRQAVEAVSTPTTRRPGTTSTLPPRFDTVLPVAVTGEELAGPGFDFRVLPPAEGLQVITQVVGRRAALFAFGHPTLDYPRRGLWVGRWNGAWWTDPEPVVPETEMVTAIDGGKAGFVVASAVGGPARLLPGDPHLATYRLHVSDDGLRWEEVAAPPGIIVTNVIVAADSAWLVGYETSQYDRALIDALSPAIQDLVAEGEVRLSSDGFEQITIQDAAGAWLASVEVADVELVDPIRRLVLFRSSDLRQWEQVPAPPLPGRLLATGTDGAGRAFLASVDGIWRNTTGDEWEQAVALMPNTVPLGVDATEGGYMTLNPVVGATEVHRYATEGTVARFRFGLDSSVLAPGMGSTSTDLGTMFALGGELEIEIAADPLQLEDGYRLVVDPKTFRYRLLDTDGEEALTFAIYEPDQNRRFDPIGRTVSFLIDSGTTVAAVDLSRLTSWLLNQVRWVPSQSSAVLYSIGDEWRLRNLADLGMGSPTLISSVSSLGSTYVVATGPLYPWTSTPTSSQIWIASPRPAATDG